ncbi:TATA element modulatory factor 1 TATA binding-domain-containing protein [Coniochaeta sp. 2T2.1]|nr:TATA element modulatory factor 1 TATA binding-domain-containing protein [Coniochaeta sp. 2T2.1]
MSSSGGKSGWGSLLSKAVAGVEARLDTILAEGDEAQKDNKSTQPTATSSAPAPAPAPAQKQPSGTSSTGSKNRTNDRLQERLARAMAAKAAAQKTDATRSSLSAQPSPRQSLDVPSRASTESADDRSSVNLAEPSSQRTSQDLPRVSDEQPASEQGKEGAQPNGQADEPSQLNHVFGHMRPEDAPVAEANGSTTPAPLPAPTPARTSVESEIPSIEVEAAVEADSKPAEPQNAREDVVLQHQEEIHGYIERIDALEAKLQYLAREAGETARKEALAAPAGSVEKKLAEKDQQIAQLMEEGKNLASTEQKHRTIIKKLRTQATDDEKELKRLKDAHEKATKEVEGFRRRARRADELERVNRDLERRLEQSQKELSNLKPQLSTKDNLVSELSRKLAKATEQADAMTAKVNDQALEQHKKRITELEESVAALQVEKNLVSDRAKIQVNEMKEKAERATERTRALELELRAELQIMESKLEAMRVQAEEVSSGAGGDSQAKLLRQIETLQTQYSIASENWQGIESTLLARIANLEKERDEALQRESDMRKKAREAALRAKRTEEELEEARTKIPTFQEDVKSYESQLDSLKRRAEQAETALFQARAELEKQKLALQQEQAEKAQQERHNSDSHDRRGGWLDDIPAAPFTRHGSSSRPESPLLLTTPQRTFSSDLLGLDILPNKLRKVSAPSSQSGMPSLERPYSGSRRPSAQPPIRPSIPGSMTGQSVFSPTSESMPPPPPLYREDSFEGVETSSNSPQQVMQDMVSVSTVAAGPSVQLVERMSAAIRRLESEKVAAREELARISNQRDEARAELVAMMREVEEGKQARKKVEELERQVAEVNERYETTLELLGEKSELVEELKADVQDVKDMYRDLVERTVR